MSSYDLYGHIKLVEYYFEDKNQDNWNQMVFQQLRFCLNDIGNTVRFNRKLPFFDLKTNWDLLKGREFEKVLENVKNWLQQVDIRYNGVDWDEQRMNPNHKNTVVKSVITQEDVLKWCKSKRDL